MKPDCWDAICYAAGTTRNGSSVTLSQSDCRELTAYVIQLTARGMADQPATTETGFPEPSALAKEQASRLDAAEPAPQCNGSCGSLFCGAIYGRKADE